MEGQTKVVLFFQKVVYLLNPSASGTGPCHPFLARGARRFVTSEEFRIDPQAGMQDAGRPPPPLPAFGAGKGHLGYTLRPSPFGRPAGTVGGEGAAAWKLSTSQFLPPVLGASAPAPLFKKTKAAPVWILTIRSIPLDGADEARLILLQGSTMDQRGEQDLEQPRWEAATSPGPSQGRSVGHRQDPRCCSSQIPTKDTNCSPAAKARRGCRIPLPQAHLAVTGLRLLSGFYQGDKVHRREGLHGAPLLIIKSVEREGS